MANYNKDCGCSGISPCNPPICTSNTPAQCEEFILSTANTEDPVGLSDVTDVSLNVKKISAYREHLEFVNSPLGLSNIVGHTVLRLSQRFINSISNLFRGRNVGGGTEIYKGNTLVGSDTFQDFKTLNDSTSITFTHTTDTITPSVDPTWLNGQLPTINYPVIDGESVGGGVPVYSGLNIKKIQLASFEGADGVRVSKLNDKIIISLPASGSTNSNTLYLDPSYVRSLGEWTATETIVNISEGLSSVPVPTGKLNDPFISYRELLAYMIGNSPNSRIKPRYQNIPVVILSSTSTSEPMEYNYMNIEVMNRCNITYTGIRSYAIDFESLFTAMPLVGGFIEKSVVGRFGGEFLFFRQSKGGFISHKTDLATTKVGQVSTFNLVPKSSGIVFSEYIDKSIYNTPLTSGDGTTPITHGGLPVYGANVAPSIALIKTTGKSVIGYSFTITDGSIQFILSAERAMESLGGGQLNSSAEIGYITNNNYISYETKLWAAKPLITSDELELLTNRSDIYFKPYENSSVFNSENGSFMRLERVRGIADVVSRSGVGSIFRVKDNSRYLIAKEMSDLGGASGTTFIKAEGLGNRVELYTVQVNSYFNYFYKQEVGTVCDVYLVHSNINPVGIIYKGGAPTSISTLGTMSTLKLNPFITMSNYVDNTAALVNLIPGMLYRNTTTNEITQVV